MAASPLIALPIEQLRRRSSTKWRTYADDVLPLFVAESDFELAPAITRVLAQAVASGDTGYTPPRHAYQETFAAFHERRFGVAVDPARVRTTGDVVMGLVEILRGVIEPGDGVVITPPVYPPFFDTVTEAGGTVSAVPLLASATGWSLDLDGIEAAFQQGARAVLLCNPHNPTGTVHSRETLAALASLAAQYGAWIVSDEIHAPLVRPGVTYTPFLSASDEAAARGFTVTSASKAYNLAGLKTAAMVTAAAEPAKILSALPMEVEWRTGLFGVLAGIAAYSEESDAWLDSLLVALEQNRRIVADGVSTISGAAHLVPDAGYLAWINMADAGIDRDPSRYLLHRAKVALNSGPTFGAEGEGYVRMNFATSPEILREAFTRIAAAL